MFDYCTIVGLRTFQPLLVHKYQLILFKTTPTAIADPVMQNRRLTERIFVGLIFLSIIMTFNDNCIV